MQHAICAKLYLRMQIDGGNDYEAQQGESMAKLDHKEDSQQPEGITYTMCCW